MPGSVSTNRHVYSKKYDSFFVGFHVDVLDDKVSIRSNHHIIFVSIHQI